MINKENLFKFKKDSNERTLSENIVAKAYYHLKVLKVDEDKNIGAIETVLLIEGFIKPNEDYEYKKYNKKFLFFNYTEEQTYNSLILEMAENYLKSKNIL